MITRDTLDFMRLYNLLMIQVKSQIRTIAIVAIVIVLFLYLFSTSDPSNISPYLSVLYCGGFVVTSRIFNDLHNPQQGYLFLMLPCSNLERFLSKWFLSSIGYAIATLLLCYLFSVLVAAMNLFHGKQILNLMQPDLWIEIVKYIILQSVILLGAISFRSYSLIKTAIVLGCFFLIFSLFSVSLAMLAFFPFHVQQGAAMMETSLTGWYLAFWLALAPICWYITYLRITEYELK